MFVPMVHAQNRLSTAYSTPGYGYLYNWYAAANPKIAPTNWRVPSSSDQSTLINFLSNEGYTTNNAIPLKYTSLWDSNGNGTDLYNFAYLPSGERSGSLNGLFRGKGFYSFYWYDILNLGRIEMWYDDDEIKSSSGVYLDGNPIRLIYSGFGSPGNKLIDYDGNEYNIIKIGTQYWLRENWKCTKLNDGTSLTKVTSSLTWQDAEGGDYYYCAYDNDESSV